MEDSSIINILNEVKKGNDDSFDTILEKYRPLMKSSISKIKHSYGVINDEFDKDLEDETTFALLDAARTYDNLKNVTFGLYASICIRNRLINFMNKSMRQSKIISNVDINNLHDIKSDLPSPEDDYISKEFVSNIYSAIDHELTEIERNAFYMHLDDFSYEDIANAIGISKKAVDNALRRAKKKLREIINQKNL